MNPNEDPSIQPQATETSPKRVKKVLFAVLLVIVVAGAMYGGFAVGKNQNPKPTAATAVTTNTTTTNTKELTSAHFVQSVGYPFDIKDKKLVFELGLPNSFQAVVVQSTNSDPGYTAYLTNKLNDELARFLIGNPKLSTATREISLIAIGKEWLNATTQTTDIIEFEDVSTPAKKKQYVDSLASTSSECAKDTKKGFQTSDKSLSICYILVPGKESWSPLISLKGYGNFEGMPVVLLGYIDVSDGKVLTQDEDRRLVSEARQGKYPTGVQEKIQEVISALSQSKLTLSTR